MNVLARKARAALRTAQRARAHLPLLAVALAMSACSLLPAQTMPEPPPLLTPASLERTVSVLQIVHGAFHERDLVFQCVVDVDPQRLSIVGLSAQGQRWFSLRDDGRGLEAESTVQAPGVLDPRRVVADLQLALWPLAALQNAFAGSAWEVSQPAPATRRLRRQGRLISEVRYASADPWQGTLWLSNFESGYALTIESRPLQ
ncbi:DUF3261 domain-containing protein [Panacagrimonas sp.]|uniref:DUF3261 domain-containing protein n=1 Tax=Panacagrimonas sp. TaxID=2480088 RepID=UPI003B52E8C7